MLIKSITAACLIATAMPVHAADRVGFIDLGMAHEGGKCFTFNLFGAPDDILAVPKADTAMIMLLIAKATPHTWAPWGYKVKLRVTEDVAEPTAYAWPPKVECDAGGGRGALYLPYVVDVWGIR